MKLYLTYQFSRSQSAAISEVLKDWLLRFKPDYNFVDECISHAVLLEWYKKHLTTFTFPEDTNDIFLNSAEALAFLKHFQDNEYQGYEGAMFNNICQDIVALITGAIPPSQKQNDRLTELENKVKELEKLI